jgi:2-oxoglutarate ferredoxin oxidoreductase subunit beta
MNIGTDRKIQWCPGCGNFAIYNALKHVFEHNIDEGKIKEENLVLISGIGCYGYITNYYHTNSFHGLHGRVPPLATGVKLANPELLVIGFAGDGDAYAEGMSHTIHAARRNTDIKLIIHDNGVYGLTTGQFTPTSPKGFKGRSTPFGNVENPINPITLMLVSQATFVARAYSGDIKHLEYVFEKAIFHKGFAVVDVLQPCVTFNNTYDYLGSRVYKLEDSDYKPDDYEKAIEKSLEFGDKIPLGIFYEKQIVTFEEAIRGNKNLFYDRETPDVADIVNERI